jgi:hypothetical protein
MPTSTVSTWFVLATILSASTATWFVMTISIAAVLDENIEMRKYVKGQTVGDSSSRADPKVVLEGTGIGTTKCSNNDIVENSSSATVAQITFKALGFPKGNYADIIGGSSVNLYSTDIGTTSGAGISMKGASGSGSIYPEGFTLQIGNAIVTCPPPATERVSLASPPAIESNQNAAYNLGDVSITGKCGDGVQFSAKDTAEPFQIEGDFRGDVLCISSTGELADICPALTGRDSDGDGIDDSCDPTPYLDLDGDGIGDQRYEKDNCSSMYNPDQSDRNRNDIGDVCELNLPRLTDADGDFIGDQEGEIDNCPYTYNPDQIDIDHDGIGEICDPHPSTAPVYPGQMPIIQSREPEQSSPDRDHDNIPDKSDNCANKPNQDQKDFDHDKIGDECDNCAEVYNADQADGDRDGRGDVCDNAADTPNPNQADADRDKVPDVADNAPHVSNPNQVDTDRDGVGNVADNCPTIANPNQKDKDKDGIGDVCDASSGPGKQGQPPGQQKGPPGKPAKPS